MAGVFISYAREDRPVAQQIAGILERNGYQVWWDRELVAGNQYADVIETKLDTADAVIVLWSGNSRKSHWVRDEAAVGRDRNRLIPLALDEMPPPLGFRQLHTPSLAGWNGGEDDRLSGLWISLSGLAGQPFGTQATPQAPEPPQASRGAIIAGVNAQPNNKSMADILKGEKRQRSFLQTFWATSLLIAGVAAAAMAILAPGANMMMDLDGTLGDTVAGVIAAAIIGFLLIGPMVMLGRFFIVVGRRLSKRKSLLYFDQPTLICFGLSGLIGLSALFGGEAANSVADNLMLAAFIVAMFFVFFALCSIPIGFFKGLGRKTFEDGK
jgi:TIR domain